ncbi:MAG: alpha/beta fold hydrolase [Bdellovibrionota bacterium]
MLFHPKNLKFLACTALAALTFSSSCKTVEPSSGVLSEKSRTKTDAFFAEMYKKYNPYPIQDDPETPDDCQSLYKDADPSVPYKGVVVYFHGFTACPQQFYEFAQIMSKQGYAALAVLMPGQGRAPAPFNNDGKKMINGRKYKDYYSEYLPIKKGEDWKRYLNFVSDVNTFAATLPGEKLVTGLSVGGQLAAYAYVERPGLYKRALLISSYLGMPGSYSGRNSTTSNGISNSIKRVTGDTVYHITKAVSQQGSNLDIIADREVSWGDKCYQQTRGFNGNPGRRGICDFHVENIAAINSLGEYIVSQIKASPALTQIPQIQYVGPEWDTGGDTLLVRKAIGYQKARFGDNKVSACFFPNVIPHSMFSRKDIAVMPETPWINSFMLETTKFLATGATYQVSQEPSEETLWDGATDRDSGVFQKRCDVYPVDYAKVSP